MKIMRYLLHPLKILVYLMVILSLIYFRSVIFLPNINQYVDTAQQFIEDKLDVSIPVYVNKNRIEDKVVERDETAETTTDLCDNDTLLQKELVSDAVDNKPVVAENSESEADKKELEAVDGKVDKSVSEIDVFAQLTDAINDLNRKVDELFDASKSNVNNAVKTPDNTAPLMDANTKNLPDKNSAIDESVDKNVKTDMALTADVKHIFYMARQTFWMGDVLGAEKLYLELATIDNENPDVYGELGNIYYTQGKWEDAGKAYYEAAIRLLNSNKNNQVNYLLRVIQGLDSDSAEKLKQKLSS